MPMICVCRSEFSKNALTKGKTPQKARDRTKNGWNKNDTNRMIYALTFYDSSCAKSVYRLFS